MSVLEIQQALKAAGFDPGPLDGKSGPRTRAAIKAYQQANGLDPDGIAGPLTQAKLRGGGSTAGAPVAGAAPADEWATYQQKYPQFAWAFADPEVGNLLRQAMAGKWGPDELQGKILQTNWYRSKTNAERDWLQTLALNPADASRQVWNYDSITKYIGLAKDYGIPVSFDAAQRQVERVVRGESTPDALGEELRRQAKALYPQLSQQLDAGATVADIYAPYKQMAASLLGINPEDVNLSDPKWQTPLQYVDKSGQRRLATTDEWQRLMKTDTRFGYATSKVGRAEGGARGDVIDRVFGVIA